MKLRAIQMTTLAMWSQIQNKILPSVAMHKAYANEIVSKSILSGVKKITAIEAKRLAGVNKAKSLLLRRKTSKYTNVSSTPYPSQLNICHSQSQKDLTINSVSPKPSKSRSNSFIDVQQNVRSPPAQRSPTAQRISPPPQVSPPANRDVKIQTKTIQKNKTKQNPIKKASSTTQTVPKTQKSSNSDDQQVAPAPKVRKQSEQMAMEEVVDSYMIEQEMERQRRLEERHREMSEKMKKERERRISMIEMVL
jgi:hypothetical protein